MSLRREDRIAVGDNGLKRLGFGVWGVGRIGSLHAANIHASAERAELIAIADPISKLAHVIARRF